jgi:site-specific DNA recombinase
MKKVGMYARVSPGAQEQEQTIASQIDAIEKRVASMGEAIEPQHRYVDDGWTSASLRRPALEELRDAVARGDLDCVVIHDPDRLSRRFVDQQVVLEEIERKHVEVVFVLGGVANSDEDRLALQTRGIFAEYERAKIRERTHRGRLHRARAGAPPGWSNPPYGYRYISGDKPHTGTVVVEECEAAIVRQIFAWVGDEGLRLREVSQRLTARGLKPRSSKRWGQGTLARVVHNGVYIGRAHHQKYESIEPSHPRDTRRYRRRLKTSARVRPEQEWITVTVPAIVDEALFRKAQQQLLNNRRQTAGQVKRPYLLRGLLFCSACGRKMWGFCTDYGRRYERRYYACNARDRLTARYDERCLQRPVRAEDVEQVVWDDLVHWLQEPEQLATQLEAQKDRIRTVLEAHDAEQRRLHQDMRAVTRTIERLLDAYQAGAMSVEELRARRERLEESKQQCQARIAQAEREYAQALTQRRVVDELRDLKERLQRGLERCSWQDRRDIVNLLVDKIEVVADKLRVHYIVPLGHEPQSPRTPPHAPETAPFKPGSERTNEQGSGLFEPCRREDDHDHDHDRAACARPGPLWGPS